jgi:DNA-binding GntR family transcriptional regulator
MASRPEDVSREGDGDLGPPPTVVLHRLSARSLSERAYLLIRDLIVTLELRPGSVIEEARLCRELNLGRTPVREALKRLTHERLVRSVPHRGAFVMDINITDLARLTEVRVELEGFGARLAAERANADDHAAMRTLMAELAELTDTNPDHLIQFDQRIHRVIWQASHNRFLEDACEQHFTHSLRLWFLVIHLVDLKVAVEEHSRLLDAIVARDGGRAQDMMRRHVTGFEAAVRRVL